MIFRTGLPISIATFSPRRVSSLLRWLLGALFICSGMIKLQDPDRFATIIAGFGVLPDRLLFPAALVVPLVEIAAGIGTLFAVRGSLAVLTGMLAVFMAVLAWGMHLGLDIDCGCFGPEDPEQAYKGLKAAFLRDVCLMVAVIVSFWGRDRDR